MGKARMLGMNKPVPVKSQKGCKPFGKKGKGKK